MRKRYQYRKVLKAHQQQIYSYALYFLRNREDADDVTQETFIRLWMHWQEVEPDKRGGWLRKVNHNLCIDYARKRKMKLNRMTSFENDPFFDIAETSPAANPEMKAALSEQQQILMKALEKLPDQSKSILIMHYLQGLKLREISDALELNINTVKVTLLRGRKQMKQLMEKQYPEIAEAYS